uniref:Pectate lyase superfamily protein domain-containing protein n=1 Tax=Aureoumbra lagunensis TaxID=44058 RepID=A0A7S3JRR9_9STRA|mmetsp:Transcript_22439/g.29089  ORF Transcript_22439/g.29089 Transcript_22439/m.29089 type:complete len:511 (-) Transcript_22439:116-1648(-)
MSTTRASKASSSCVLIAVIVILLSLVRVRNSHGERRKRIGIRVISQEDARKRLDAVFGDIGRTIATYESLERIETQARRIAAGKYIIDAVKVLSIFTFGAVGNGSHDDGPALERALVAAKIYDSKVMVHLPAGHRYFIGAPILISEISNVELRIDGIVLAPRELYQRSGNYQQAMSPEQERMQFAFFTFAHAKNFTLSGAGEIDGRGKRWWRMRKRNPREKAPVLILFRDSYDIIIRHLELHHSPFYHLVLLRTHHVLIDRLQIYSPSSSINTDGIDILESSEINIHNCWISTGDDNLAIKEGSSRVYVRGGFFFRGHGLSIGSLGEGGTTASVKHVYLANVTFIRTTNAARIKTWQGGQGAVKNITFTHLYVAGVSYPIVIDQFYCPQSQHPGMCSNSSYAVKVSDVQILHIAGWHTSGVAASLHCSHALPCTITLEDLHLRSAPGCSNVVRCLNVRTRPLSSIHSSSSSSSSLSNACQHGDEMHGYRLDLTRKERRRLAANFSCIHPP